MTPADMNKWIKSMRKKHPHWTYVYIPQAHDDMVSYDPKNGPDFVAPMLYYSNYNSYPVSPQPYPRASPNPKPSPIPNPNPHPRPYPHPDQGLDISHTGNQKNEAMYALLKLKQVGG